MTVSGVSSVFVPAKLQVGPITLTDPLTRVESYDYDLSGNLKQHTDRRGKVTSYIYDKLDRMKFAGFGSVSGTPPQYESTIDYTYDSASRLTQVADSVSGAIQLSYDDLDRQARHRRGDDYIGCLRGSRPVRL